MRPHCPRLDGPGFGRSGPDRSSPRPNEPAARWRRLVRIVAAMLLAPLLSACILGTENPDLALDGPARYRTAHSTNAAAVPALDWWRGFRSPELTSLVEQAHQANFDIAVAVAQILQA